MALLPLAGAAIGVFGGELRNPLALPKVGDYELRVLSPTVLELVRITSKEPDPARVAEWDFVGSNFELTLPLREQFEVTAGGSSIGVSAVGFKRRVAYAPVSQRDLRIGNHLYLHLQSPVKEGAVVEVKNPSGNLWPAEMRYVVTNSVGRLSPVIHVNQVGYEVDYPKVAMIGYYLGSLGELKIGGGNGFKIIAAESGAVVYEGSLQLRKDQGFGYSPTPYQEVYQADFSGFNEPGEYRLMVPGLGVSHPFRIERGVLASFARTFALGLYHQRSGMEKGLPVTRHGHGADHTAPAEVPTAEHKRVEQFLAEATADYANEPRHTAPRLKDVNSSLYPFVRQGLVDVSGGHHDAGDYSKYTINSASLIHHLVFAVDAFPGVAGLDNLGLPESGDGRSDLLQEAKWEADFLAKMQDADGGFYFLVYPRDRRYEDNVLPDKGDPQVVWPKTTAVTAAAVAALAEIGSSPTFKEQFPVEAALYMEKAVLGWLFLEAAIAKHGKNGSYQKITHYGHEFMHDDELAWAAAAMFAATGELRYHLKLKEWYAPGDSRTRRWSWWKLYEGYGCAARTYAFAARSGRLNGLLLDPVYLQKCEAEIIGAGEDQVRFAEECAYGTSFPDQNKRYRSAGWYFSSERAFDITAAYQLEPKESYRKAVVSNVNYEAGCNPVNKTYITGIGYERQLDVVHQYSQNDRRILPASGLPLGNVQAGFIYLYHYKRELTALSYPPDNATTAPYPYYDRWGDSFNTTAEFVVVDQARSLASLSFWMAETPLRDQAWKPVMGQVVGVPDEIPAGREVAVTLEAPGVDLTGAQIVWEMRDQEPVMGGELRVNPSHPGVQWLEAEALLPDGRRVFAITNFVATYSLDEPPNSYQSVPVAAGGDVAALYHLDEGFTDAAGRQAPLQAQGNAGLNRNNLGWMEVREGQAAHFGDLGDRLTGSIAGGDLYRAGETRSISLEGMIFIDGLRAYTRSTAVILSLSMGWDASLQLLEDPYGGLRIKGGGDWEFGGPALTGALSSRKWHHVRLSISETGYSFQVNGQTVATKAASSLATWGNKSAATLTVGDFDGWIDEIVVRSEGTTFQGGTEEAPVAANPMISPRSGSYYKPVTVTMETATAGATIRYTLDGTTPTESSVAYTGALSLSASTVVKARAFKSGFTPSATAEGTYQLNDPQPGTVTATYRATDTLRRGDWKGVYGADGYHVIGNAERYPVYAKVRAQGQSAYTWTNATSDKRALEKADPATDRIAAAWYAAESFEFSVQLEGAEAKRMSLYFLDWDSAGRAQAVEIFDAVSGGLLDSRFVQDFIQGRYMVWELTGDVRVRVTRLGGPNAVLMGIFFDETEAGTPVEESGETVAVYEGMDAERQGDWTGHYGSAGAKIAPHAMVGTSGVDPTWSGHSDRIWSETTADKRALEQVGKVGRTASAWYGNQMMAEMQFSGTAVHRVSLYFLDWDRSGRVQQIDVIDAQTGKVLDSRELSQFGDGVYLTWNVRGHVLFQLTRIAGPSAVASGIFFDGGQTPQSTEPAAYLRLPDGRFQLRVDGVAGTAYIVEATTDFKTWEIIGTHVLTASTGLFLDHEAAGKAIRFYRVRELR